MTSPKKALKEIFFAAVEAARPDAALRKRLRLHRKNGATLLEADSFRVELSKYKNIYVIGAGKAVCDMASGIEALPGDLVAGGCVVTKYGHGFPLKKIRVMEAGHPVPDTNGAWGAEEILYLADRAGKGDLLICLFTGGASALIPAPVPSISLEEKQKVTGLLLGSGADIHEMNAVRKHLSLIKGGHLSKRAWPADVLTLIVSDVVGDEISTIASGPTAPDETTYNDCLAILKKYSITNKTPRRVLEYLESGASGVIEETPKPGDGTFRKTRNLIIADNSVALEAAARKARSLGYAPLILSSTITGPTCEAARFFSSVLKEVKKSGNPVRPPACVLMGGETTLTVTGRGLGGRNQEFALRAAFELAGTGRIMVLAAGTDGTDGPTDAAGAFAGSGTIEKALKAGLDPIGYLADNDSYHFFKKLNGLFVTGPTGTNVMDIMIGVVA